MEKINFKTLGGILETIEQTAIAFEKNNDIPTASTRLQSCNLALKAHILEHAIDRFKTERLENENLRVLRITDSKKSK